MKLRIASLLLLTVCCLMLAVAPSMASTIINNTCPPTCNLLGTNGPLNGHRYAWDITQGYEVSDSFSLPNGAVIVYVEVGLWVPHGDVPMGVDYQIGTTSFGGTTVFALLSNVTHFTNIPPYDFPIPQCGTGCDVYTADFSVNVGWSGSGYLTLSNGITNTGGWMGWDENLGPATAYENTLGSIPSEDPDFYGYINGTTPEPSSLILFGSGILGLAGVLRRGLMG
jgi:PEP-CTERM motif